MASSVVSGSREGLEIGEGDAGDASRVVEEIKNNKILTFICRCSLFVIC